MWKSVGRVMKQHEEYEDISHLDRRIRGRWISSG